MSDFFGTYSITLEKTGRFRFPGDIADSFGDTAYLCRWPGPCVKIYPEPEWHEYMESLRALGKRRNREDEWEIRTVFSSREEATIKLKGRLTIPQELRDYAKLKAGEKIIVIGAMDHLELWASEDAYNAAMERSLWQG